MFHVQLKRAPFHDLAGLYLLRCWDMVESKSLVSSKLIHTYAKRCSQSFPFVASHEMDRLEFEAKSDIQIEEGKRHMRKFRKHMMRFHVFMTFNLF